MRIWVVMLLCLGYQAANAEVFKCVGKHGQVLYQPSPCNSAIKQQQLEIKSDPEVEAQARTKLEEVRSEYESRKAAQQEAQREAMEQRNQQLSIDAAQRSAFAQQQQANEQRRQNEAIEGQVNRPVYVVPPVGGAPGYGSSPGAVVRPGVQ